MLGKLGRPLIYLSAFLFVLSVITTLPSDKDISFSEDKMTAKRHRLLFIVPITRNRIRRHLMSLTSNWLQEVQEVGLLLYVVGRGEGSHETVKLPSSVVVLEVDVADDDAKDKELLAFRHIEKVFPFEYAVVFDSETYVHPPRLLELLSGYNATNSSYRGQHIPSWNDGGRQHCSGAYLVDRKTVIEMSKENIKGRNKGVRPFGLGCTTSTTTAGVKSLQDIDPRRGKSALFCEESIADELPIRFARPYNYPRSYSDHCVTFHPQHQIEDMRFVRYLVTREEYDGTVLRSPCRIAIGILSTVHKSKPRTAVRATWGALARALGVQLYFVVGTKPDAQEQLEREQQTYGDIVQVDVEESYRNLFSKTVEWMKWASSNTACQFVMKTDDDTYIRVLPLLRWLYVHFGDGGSLDSFGTLVPQKYAYVGMQWGGKRRVQPKVVSDPESPWYNSDLYPHTYYPPYMSGSGYLLTRDLASQIGIVASHHPSYRAEDAGVGILVDDFVKLGNQVGYYTGREFSYRHCLEDTILDNPAFSMGFNMYDRFQADLDGIFCLGVNRSGLTSPGTHVLTSLDMFDDARKLR